MKRPRKAIILAAGLATRLQPLSHHIPKCLFPLFNKPLLDHTLDQLADWGVGEVLINLHHVPGPILDHIRARNRTTPRITFSYEPAILGTGGALRQVTWFAGTEPVWMINGDIAFDVSPTWAT